MPFGTIRRGTFITAEQKAARKRQRKLNDREKDQVKRIVNRHAELKYFTAAPVNGAAVPQAGAGANFDISNVAQGLLDTNRVGDRLEWCGKMDIYLQIVGPESLTGLVNDIYNTVRFIIFQYHPHAVGGTSPVPTEILLNGPTGAIDVGSQYNHDQRQNYKILYDRVFTLVNNQNSTVGGTGFTAMQNNHVHTCKFRVSLKNAKKDAQFNAAGTNGTNKIFYFMISDSAAAPNPTYSLITKIFFRDS